MSRSIRLAALLLAPALAAATWARELKPYVRDEVHSQINFTGQSRMIDAQGTWDQWAADIRLDPDALAKSSVTITIQANSVNTQIGKRDDHLRSCAFFCADSFPTITFKSKIVNAPGAGTDLSNTKLNLTGELTIRGITKTITIPSTLVFFDREQRIGRVKGQFTILRKDFGVGFDPVGNPVANEVPVQFDIAFRPAPPA